MKPVVLAKKSHSPLLRFSALGSALALLLAGGGAGMAVLGSSKASAQAAAVPGQRPKLPPPPAAPSRPAPPPSPMGEPLAGLDAASLAAFNEGRSEFLAQETPAGGLGPIFNDRSCAACHSAGGVGGGSRRSVTRFGRLLDGQFDAMAAQGGSLLQARAIDPAALEHVPAEASIVAQRITTPLFGAGLIEAITDDTIVQGALRSKLDGVRGTVAWIIDPASGTRRVGRFGWKAQHASLLGFSADAYLNEMGITNRLFRQENAPNGNTALLARFDRVADIEDQPDPLSGRADIDRAADFMRLLAAPAALRPSAQTLAGARLFDRSGCTACHTPSLNTGASPWPALAFKNVPLYSDLLLHDMGSLGDGIAQDAAGRRDMRTAPLWGLRVRERLLHDGRAATPREAVLAHEGEAAPARQRFQAMNAAEQQAMLDFLRSL
ncbi:di-heme oxidoredictase family protein [Paucibacter sp. DJ2R-2]|uniref:di-heme oxidoredictase family protein n=1 Tax=Paucibacter sp. DJ2R-2 TaxID=2893558 RepID=UPI0021E39704|nr:di-heme oxidoredictase family protein [Paucibacter sp. DJ2R-2]MCV2420206.1 hypothetical protein [Paucibacter sp. DJ4R-1]MCV2436849.1 hypothetical protein [Paucibacter sp. DJ2R-2]